MNAAPVCDERHLERVWLQLQRGHRGPARATTKKALAQACALPPRRGERAVQELRRRGRPIGSSCGQGKAKGYYVAETVEQLDSVIGQLDDRVRTQVMTLHGLRSAREGMVRRRYVEPDGQRRLFAAGREQP